MCHGYMLSLSTGETFFVHGVVNRLEIDIFSGSVFFLLQTTTDEYNLLGNTFYIRLTIFYLYQL